MESLFLALFLLPIAIDWLRRLFTCCRRPTVKFVSGGALSWEWIHVSAGTKTLLHDQDMHTALPLGTVTALFGPSGSGKTTLLTALARRSFLQTSGHVDVGGHPMEQEWMRDHSVFVPTEPYFVANQFVRTFASFHARLNQRKASIVHELLETFSLHPRQRIRTLSSGERKRLQLIAALMSSPQFLFLDEPTSGLSDADALLLMNTIHSIANSRHIAVILSIHQPRNSIFMKFDNVLLMANGRILLRGAPVDLMQRLQWDPSGCRDESFPCFLSDALYNPQDHDMLKAHDRPLPLLDRTDPPSPFFSSSQHNPSLYCVRFFFIHLANSFDLALANLTLYAFGGLVACGGVFLFGMLFASPIHILSQLNPDGIVYMKRIVVFFSLSIAFDFVIKFKSIIFEREKRCFQRLVWNRHTSPFVDGVSSLCFDALYLLLFSALNVLFTHWVTLIPCDPHTTSVSVAVVWLYLLTVLLWNRTLTFAIPHESLKLIVCGFFTFVVMGFNGILLSVDLIYPSLAWIARINPLYYAHSIMEMTRDPSFLPDLNLSRDDHLVCLLLILWISWWVYLWVLSFIQFLHVRSTFQRKTLPSSSLKSQIYERVFPKTNTGQS